MTNQCAYIDVCVFPNALFARRPNALECVKVRHYRVGRLRRTKLPPFPPHLHLPHTPFPSHLTPHQRSTKHLKLTNTSSTHPKKSKLQRIPRNHTQTHAALMYTCMISHHTSMHSRKNNNLIANTCCALSCKASMNICSRVKLPIY